MCKISSQDSQSTKRAFGFTTVLSLGLGAMLGGGIFVLFAFSIEIGQGGTPFAFALAGLVALLTSYSYTRLSLTYPGEGGTIDFINHAFGRGLFSGVVNLFLWLNYMVVLALYAYAFSSYAIWFIPAPLQPLFKPLVICAIILLLITINVLSVEMMGKTQIGLILVKILLLVPFIAIGLLGITHYGYQFFLGVYPVSVIAAGMIVFVSYEGFELIANTALEVRNPETTLPRTYYATVLVVTTLYILLSVVAIGNLSLSQIIAAQDYALAFVADTVLGIGGFGLIVIVALLATSSAMNATIYGTAKMSIILAHDQQLPQFFTIKIKGRPLYALAIIALVTILIATLCDLYAISLMGSVGFLFIFTLVNSANLHLSKTTNCRRFIPILGVLFCIIAIAISLWFTIFTRPLELIGILAIGLTALFFQIIYRKTTQKT